MYTCAVWTFDHVGVLTGSYSYVVGKHCIMSYVGIEESVSAIAWTLLLKWLAMWCVDALSETLFQSKLCEEECSGVVIKRICVFASIPLIF